MRQSKGPRIAPDPLLSKGYTSALQRKNAIPAAITGLVPALDRRLECTALVGAGLRCGTGCRARLYVGHGGLRRVDVAFA